MCAFFISLHISQGRQGVLPPEKLIAEVDSVARLVAKKQGGGLQLPAFSVLDEHCCVQLRRRLLLFLSQVHLAPGLPLASKTGDLAHLVSHAVVSPTTPSHGSHCSAPPRGRFMFFWQDTFEDSRGMLSEELTSSL